MDDYVTLLTLKLATCVLMNFCDAYVRTKTIKKQYFYFSWSSFTQQRRFEKNREKENNCQKSRLTRRSFFDIFCLIEKIFGQRKQGKDIRDKKNEKEERKERERTNGVKEKIEEKHSY